MKSVLVSLKPYYYYLVGEGIKKIEVRKNMPRASDWNKEVLFYMSKDVKSFAKIPKEFQEKYREHFGEVGMQFVCDRIEEFYCASVPYKRENNLGYGHFVDNGVYKVNGWHEGVVFERNDRYIDTMLKNKELDEMCLSAQEIFDYIGIGKYLYGWHISDLVIYDKPKPIMQFYKTCPIKLGFKNCPVCELYSTYTGCCMNNIDRPPQSWVYVDELE